MILPILLILGSLVLLYFGADWLVKGSSSLAVRLGISTLVVGLTVVAFGTSAPELTVSLHAALKGQNDISIGNVVGSNIINICCILGLSALITPMRVNKRLARVDTLIMVVATLVFVLFFLDKKISRFEGGILFAGIISYLTFIFFRIKADRKARNLSEEPEERIDVTKHWLIDLLLMLVGLGILVFGARLLVDNAVIIATALGMSQAVIGMTIVALGTSLPEMATSVVAAIKKKNDIAIGNIVGSNMFNLLAVLGPVALIKPIESESFSYFDSFFLLGISVLLYLLMIRHNNLNRKEGLLLFLLYVGYVIYIIYNGQV